MEIDQTLYGAVNSAAKRYPRLNALYYKGRNITYSATLREIDALAAGLSRAGIKRGDVVTVCMPNVPESIYALYAVNKLGAVAHMVHPLAPAAQLKRFMEKAGSRLLFVLNIALKDYAELADCVQLGIVSVSPARSLGRLKRKAYDFINRADIVKGGGIRDYDAVTVKRGASEAAPYESGRTAVYLHSGGTGGEPKVIELSDMAVNALASRVPDILDFMDRLEGTAMLAVLPMFHGFGLAMGVHAPLCYGAVSALMPKFSTRETIKLISEGKLNYLIGVPALYEALLRKPEFSGEKLKNIRIAFIGGDCVMPDLLDRFDARMREGGSGARLFEGYGLTETVTVCNVNLFSANRAGSVGKPLPGLECVILGSDGAVLEAGETGEICIAGDTLMNGYLNDATATAEAFTELGGKKFVRTGDAGYLDADGYLYFRQRIKRIIKIAGVSVYPSEIEAAAGALGGGITEACAIEGKRDGKTVIELYLVSSFAPGERLSAEAVRDGICKALGKYAVPSKVEYLDRLPKTLINKVDVNALKRLTGGEQ